jgi:hypothetical protein
MSINSPWLQVSAVSTALLAAGAGLVLSNALSVANVGWLGAFGLACVATLLFLRERGRPARTMAQILWDTENPGRSDRER